MNPVKRDPVTGLFVKDSDPMGTETPESMPDIEPKRKKTVAPADSMEKRIVELVTPTIHDAIDGKGQELEKRIRAELEKIPQRLEIGFPDGSAKPLSGTHRHPAFESCLKRSAAGLPLYLHGPTGSGKTHLARDLAEAFGQKCIIQQIISGMAEHHLLGLYAPDSDGFWRWIPSGLAEAMLEGYMYVADEVDAGDANTVTIMHTVLAERRLYVPYSQNGNRMIDAHKDFRFVATANTVSGGNRRYTARNTLDAATMNRFRLGMVHVDYDTKLEKQIVGNTAVCEWGWKVREVIADHSLPHDMSTRNLIDSAQLLQVGVSLGDCKASYFADWTPEAIRYAKDAGVC